jgi:3'-phosphoadenosine 5'-phosphosulfate sulfotransferase (PAPS reductase)/FAD synthetase
MSDGDGYSVAVEGEYSDTGAYALFSGGDDSLAATHKVMTRDGTPVDRVLYLDTNTGVPENLEYVRDVCERYGWPLIVASAPISLYEFATGKGPGDRTSMGFPGPGAHSWAFRYFKERQIQHVAQQHEDPRFYTRIRSHESERRMRTVDGERESRDGRWTYVNPIHDWRDHEVTEYRECHGLPRNPVAESIGRSGDCYCGAFASRTEELVELEAEYPGHAAWLKECERRVQEVVGADSEMSFWGFGEMSASELRGLVAENDAAQLSLCASCDIPELEGGESE